MSLTPGMNRVSRAEWTKHFNVKAMTRNCLGVTSLANLTLAAPCHKARTLRSFFTLFDVFGLSTARKPRNVSCIMVMHDVEVNTTWLFLTGRLTDETAYPLRMLAETLATRSLYFSHGSLFILDQRYEMI